MRHSIPIKLNLSRSRIYGVVVLISLLSISLSATSCLNYYVVDEAGHFHHHYESATTWVYPKQVNINELTFYEKQIPEEPLSTRHRLLSNYAAQLVECGRLPEARIILEKLRISHPDEYQIMANMAVVYELQGEYDLALALLKRSIKANPDSHEGSEWLHQQILEGLIVLRDSAADLQTFTILTFPTTQQDEHNVAHDIFYQLQERMPLSGAPDQYLSKVLEEMGDFYRKNISLEWSIEMYAGSIGYSNDTAVERRVWTKLEDAQRKLAVYHGKQSKKQRLYRKFSETGWRQTVEARIKECREFRPLRFEGVVKVDFTPKPDDRVPAANWR